MKKRNSMKAGIIVAVLLLAVGFAAVTTTLVINGTIKIVPDTQNFEDEVIFATATVDETSKTAGSTAEIAEDGKSITLTTHDLKSINETVTLTYTVENGSNYDAQFDKMVCTSDNAAYGVYISATPADVLNAKYTAESPLAAGQISVEDTVTVKMIKSYAGVEGVESGEDEAVSVVITCEMDVNAVETE